MRLELTELLKGTRPIKDSKGDIVVQSINNMQLVCLTTDDEFSINKFANPMDVLASNRNYGHLKLRNGADSDMIVPAQIAILTKKRAQNHGMVKGAYIPRGSSVDFNDAGCIQGSDTGMISESGDNEVRFIPFGARELIFEKTGTTGSHTNIYAAIEKVGRETGANSGTYLDKYFSKYDKKLSEFIAHFERPERTIGTIVFIDGEIVAVDKFPSFQYCEQVWDALIRDCYGALAITQEIKNVAKVKKFTTTLNRMRKKSSEGNADFLNRVLKKTKSKMTDNVKDRLEDLLELNFDFTTDSDSTVGNYKSLIVKTEGYIGQVISESDYRHLVSIVKKDTFDPTRLRKASEMRNLAKKQSKFEL